MTTLYLEGPMHPDLFDGETPRIDAVEVPFPALTLYDVEVSFEEISFTVAAPSRGLARDMVDAGRLGCPGVDEVWVHRPKAQPKGALPVSIARKLLAGYETAYGENDPGLQALQAWVAAMDGPRGVDSRWPAESRPAA